MVRYISLLRGVNVSGQKKIKMDVLRKLYGGLGLSCVQTYIQSGNVLFDCEENTVKLSEKIKEGIRKSFGFEVEVILRTKQEWQKIQGNTLFQNKDSTQIYVVFLARKPEMKRDLNKANKVKDAQEEFVILGREVYLFLPNGMGRTKLSNTFWENMLNVPATTRNWNTVRKLGELMEHIL